MIITNYVLDPACLKSHSVYQGKATQQANGLWKYEQKDSTVSWSTLYPIGSDAKHLLDTTPLVMYARFAKSTDCTVGIYHGGTSLLSSATEAAFLIRKSDVSSDGPVLTLNGPGDSAWMILEQVGVYTQSDWQTLQSLGVTWFDGDTMPLA